MSTCFYCESKLTEKLSTTFFIYYKNIFKLKFLIIFIFNILNMDLILQTPNQTSNLIQKQILNTED